MLRIAAAAGLALVAAPALADCRPGKGTFAGELVARATTFEAGKRLQIDILGAKGEGGFARGIVVVRREGGGGWHELCRDETIQDAPLAAFFVDDRAELALTLWAAGSAYLVRAYDLRDAFPKQVLEAASKTWPEYRFDDAGRPVIRIAFGAEAEEAVWDGTRFARRPAK